MFTKNDVKIFFKKLIDFEELSVYLIKKKRPVYSTRIYYTFS